MCAYVFPIHCACRSPYVSLFGWLPLESNSLFTCRPPPTCLSDSLCFSVWLIVCLPVCLSSGFCLTGYLCICRSASICVALLRSLLAPRFRKSCLASMIASRTLHHYIHFVLWLQNHIHGQPSVNGRLTVASVWKGNKRLERNADERCEQHAACAHARWRPMSNCLPSSPRETEV